MGKTGAAVGDQSANNGGSLVFVSYTRQDAKWRDKVLVMLAPDVRERRVEVWCDQREVVGEKWRPQLDDAIRRSHAALLLISPDFLASDFIMEQELPALIEHGARLVCALLRPCRWEAVSELAELQWAHDPARALAQEKDRDGAVVRICRTLIAHLPPVGAATAGVDRDGINGDARQAAEPLDAVAAGEGALIGVPTLPPEFVAREELMDVRVALLRGGRRAVGVSGRGLGLHGQGGIGKTVLAAAIARDQEIRAHFPDGVFWITLGEHADIVGAQRALLAQLGADTAVRTMFEGKAALGRAFADLQALVVVDDVWSGAAASAFRITGPRGRVLYTTRDPVVPKAAGAELVAVGVLPPAVARELLANLTGETVATLPEQAETVLEATGRVALALALVGAAVGRGGTSWSEVIDQLKTGANTFLTHPYANVFKTMQVAVSALTKPDAQAYLSLGVYPPDTTIPVQAIARYWTHLWSHTPGETAQLLRRFAERELLVLADQAVTFHDLQRDFLLLQAEDLALLHGELLAAYRTLLPTKDASWAELPEEEPYIWEHLVDHLQGAGDGAGLIALVTDMGYLARRCLRDGSYGPESDLRHAAALYPDHAAIAWLLGLFTHWGHSLTSLSTVADLAATLWLRTHTAPAAISRTPLTPLLPARYLEPRWGLRDAPPALTRVLEGHAGGVSGVAFSPDGTVLADAGADGTVRLWDASRGHSTGTLAGHSDAVNGVAFSPDGTVLASASADETVRLWDSSSGQPVGTLEGHAGGVSGVAFSPDGTVLASAGMDGKVRLWDPSSRQPVGTLEGHTRRLYGVAFSPDGTVLASAGYDGIVLWDAYSGKNTGTLEGHTGGAYGVAFSPDGTVLASASADETVRLWDPSSGQPVGTLDGHTGGVSAVAFSPDGTVLASAGADRTVRLWDPSSGQPAGTLDGHTRGVSAVAFSSDGTVLASAGLDGTVRLWDPSRGQSRRRLEGHADGVSGVAFSPDGTVLASAGADGAVRLWDPSRGQSTRTLERHTAWVSGVAFSPDGTVLASAGGYDGMVWLWDPSSGQSIGRLAGHAGGVSGVAFSPDGTVLASASNDETVRLWDLSSAEQTRTLERHTAWVSGVAFSPDGTVLASASDDRTVRLWDPSSGQTTGRLKGHTGWVRGVTFSPDGTVLASAGTDRTVRLWDPSSGQSTGRLAGHADGVNGVAFSPDGTVLASAGDDGTLRLWTVEDRTPIAQLALGAPLLALTWDNADAIALGTETGGVVLCSILSPARPRAIGAAHDRAR